jgi:hypothetical protein
LELLTKADSISTSVYSFRKHLFLEEQTRPISAPQNQAFTAHDSGRFLERLWSARQAVPTPMPSSREMTIHLARRLGGWLLGGG